MKKYQTVAVIDDDDIYQFVAKKNIICTDLVNNVVTFSNGKEAIDFFSNHLEEQDKLPDLIFLDLNMPILDGWQFLERYIALKEKIEKQIKVYVTSSSKNPDDIILVKNINEVSDYIVKPVTFDRFQEILTR